MTRDHTIRPMTSDDVEPAADVMVGGGWGDRRRILRFALEQPEMVPLVAEADERVVGTGIATVNGPVGWVGLIFVDEGLRGRGIGTALTEAVLAELTEAGCVSFALLASPLGRPIYERLGFTAELDQTVIAAPGLGRSEADAQRIVPGGPRLRAFVPDDLTALVALDRAATGEDRAHLLLAAVDPATTVVALGPDGRVAGFDARAPWGGHPTIAPELADGVRLLEHRRACTPVGVDARTALPDADRSRLTTLENLGWVAERSLVRMVRGAPIPWHPEAVWGQFSYATG
jgi:GNAT superfamily N-acetyltransferase